ncbi:hypothetical protein HWV62_26739 [Athelia sp. TMB]|nr:hypothetical protein HWV62_26739 [Athelia sp. TMB]
MSPTQSHRHTGSVIGGSQALSFFSQIPFPKDNLNLFVNPGHGYELARHLIDIQGYHFNPFGCKAAQEFVQGIREGGAEWIEAVQRRELVYTIDAIDVVHRFIKPEQGGGEQEILLIEAREIFMTGMERRVGDSSCWTIHLSELNDHNRDSLTPTSPPILRSLLFDNTWRLVGAGSFMQMKFCVVSLPIFRYSYTVSNDTEALAMREFYDGQWPLKKSAKRAKVYHQTWWDGKVQEIKEGKAQHVDYEASTEDDSDLNVVHMDRQEPCYVPRDDKETDTTISARSYYDIHPVLINSEMKKKMIHEVLNHYRSTHA